MITALDLVVAATLFGLAFLVALVIVVGIIGGCHLIVEGWGFEMLMWVAGVAGGGGGAGLGLFVWFGGEA